MDDSHPGVQGIERCHIEFVNVCRRGENGFFDLHDGRDVLELCMAAYKSAEAGREVDLRAADLSGYTPPPARDER